MKRPDQIDYSQITREVIDDFEIKWRNIPQTPIAQNINEEIEENEEE